MNTLWADDNQNTVSKWPEDLDLRASTTVRVKKEEEEETPVKFENPSRAILPKTVMRQHGRVLGDASSYDDDLDSTSVFPISILFEETLLATEDYALTPSTIEEDSDLLIWAMDTIARSPVGLALIRRAAEEKWDVGLSDLGTGGFHLDIMERTLLIDHFGYEASSLIASVHYRNAFLLTLMRGLRDIWQETRFGALESEYRPEAVLMLERVRAADADTVSVFIAWELRTAGLPELWRHLLGSEEGDLAIALNDILDSDPSAFMNGRALSGVFRSWFNDEARVNTTDHDTLNALDMVMEWALEEGEQRPFGQRVLNAEIVEKFSCMPDGRAYLFGQGDDVCLDPVYATLSDPINEAHLFQIVHDMQVTMMDHVPFRDGDLARKIFPESTPKKIIH